MSASGPGGITPDEPDGTPSVPDDVWLKFLTDSEQAIRATAPREPAARERLHPGERPEAGRVGPGGTNRTRRTGRVSRTARVSRTGRSGGSGPVGELWQPDDPWTGPSWRELDGRARLRRAGRVAATAAAVALALTAWSQLTTGAGTPVVVPEGTTVERVEEAPAGVPTAASPSPGRTRETGHHAGHGTPATAGPDPHPSAYASPYATPYGSPGVARHASPGTSAWTVG